ncbi:unnamed protein product [Caenorhabditis auriculariae]|uniref:Peptidase S1 domain-containing protein n=1 Tax=Caenorhabditis auriculariae TaxID=2777116 RepID=A0A8S1HRM7_9PELO|nr:unnamed protein product [Caenorhabditis auriculariae]
MKNYVKNSDRSSCGKPGFIDVEKRGKTEKMVKLAPWAVLLHIDRHGDGSRAPAVCGGTLITRKHIITAAHCFRKETTVRAKKSSRECSREEGMTSEEALKRTKAIVGSTCSVVDPAINCFDELIGEEIKVVRVQIGDFFRKKCSQGNDYALLELERPVDDKFQAHHVCLPHIENVPLGDQKKLTAFGWGSDPLQEYNSIPTPFLQIVGLDRMGSEQCFEEVGDEMTKDALCTVELSKKNVCSGDSGGGITFQNKRRHYLAAIISYGSDCNSLVRGTRPKAQINTDISKYISQIATFIK